jgi:shikimate dehydrogenase
MRSAEARPRPALLGIIGYPLHHTASPALHNAAFRAVKLPWVYAPFRVEPRRLAKALEALDTVGVIGFNVTYPHKEAVIPYLAKISPEASAVGAVNTVWRTPRGWAGDNTDIVGFGAPLVRHRRELEDAPVVLFGAGGAARAAAFALVRYFKIGALQVVARRKGQADRFARWAADLAGGTAVSAARLGDVRGWTPAFRAARMVINATPVGMADPRERLLPAGARFESEQIAYDLVYGSSTDFLARARRARATVIDGVPMLGAQAAQAFEIFTGRRYPWRAVMRSFSP